MQQNTRYPHLAVTDPELYHLIEEQAEYETTTLKMIPSENFASFSVLEATGSTLTNKYAEGYPFKRYYEGNEIVDQIETLAIERAKKLFGAEHANVQPYSGSPANQAVLRALLNPGDTMMGMALPLGGHLTHGWPVNFSGTDYVQVPYGPRLDTGIIDYDAVVALARETKPKLIWLGATAYSRIIDYSKFAEVAKEIKAYLVADIAHINGLIVAGVHPNPVEICDVVTSTSHKAIRGPRGGFILSKIDDRWKELYHAEDALNLAQRIDRAVFPHLQGGPHLNVIAAMATTFHEASLDSFKSYGLQVVKNAKMLAEELLKRGYKLVSGGTDNHLLILDLKEKSYSGKKASQMLAKGGIITNFNMVPGDTRKPFVTSGVRMGTPAPTSMGMKEADMLRVAGWIDELLSELEKDGSEDSSVPSKVREEVKAFCKGFTFPGIE